MNDPKEKLESDYKSISESFKEMVNITEDLRSKNNKMIEFLVKLSTEDFRGNRPQYSIDAYNLLKNLYKIIFVIYYII